MWNLLKVNSSDCVSLLTLFKCFFWCTMNASFFVVMFLFLRFLFWFLYCEFKTDFTPWSTFSVINFKHELSHLLGWFKLKNLTKNFFSILIWKRSGKKQKQELEVFYEKRFSQNLKERNLYIYAMNIINIVVVWRRF